MTSEKFSTEFLNAEPVIPHSAGRVFLGAKRVLDILISVSLLPGLSLCAFVLLVLNPFKNPGPMIFGQERVGHNGRRFNIYKFRTMEGEREEVSPRFATEEEERINGLGAFMRRTRIDELPQLINVLKGEMSLVGPRPEQVEFYDEYSQAIPGYASRQVVKPGITGLAQLKYGYTSDEVGTSRKLRWDMEYITRMGFGLEFYIMWHTFLFVICRLLRIETASKL
ncbi:MAG: sugar transferase [Pseudomonadota bacterium]